jgi:hypothetical protein
VVLLRRQLTQEQSRSRPWIRLKPVFGGRTLVLRRDIRGVMRWPGVRIVRVLLLGVAAGACMAGVWDGTTPLIVVAALCLFLAGLDALEPLAQDVDHPDLSGSTPTVKGDVRVRHAPLPLLILIVVSLVSWGTWIALAALTGGDTHTAFSVGAAMVVPMALLAMVGAAVSIVMEPTVGGSDLLPAEIAGLKVVLRAVWAPALVVGGLTPLLFARTALTHPKVSAVAEALNAGFVPMMGGILGLGWLRFREDLHEYFKMPTTTPTKDS